MAREAFEDLVIRVYREQFDSLPDEQMVRDPRRAHQFCILVRNEARCPKLPDSAVLGCVQNLRKAARLIIPKRQRAQSGPGPSDIAAADRPGPMRRRKSAAKAAPLMDGHPLAR